MVNEISCQTDVHPPTQNRNCKSDLNNNLSMNIWLKRRKIQLLANLRNKMTCSTQTGGHGVNSQWRRSESIQTSQWKSQSCQTYKDKLIGHPRLLHCVQGPRGQASKDKKPIMNIFETI